MSESIRRRSSSRQLLQNLIRVTAQRSLEDAEEVERERRRRAREKQRGEGSPSWPEPPEHKELTENSNTVLAEELKPSCCSALEEDEGFSDWSLKLENRTEQEVQDDCRNRPLTCSASQKKSDPKEENLENDEEHEGWQTEQSSLSQQASASPPEKVSSNKNEAKTLHSSMVFLPPDAMQQQLADQPPDGLFHFAAATISPRGELCKEDVEEEQEVLQVKRRSEESCQNYREEERKKKEEQSFKQEEKGDFHLKMEEEKEEHSLPEERSVKGVYERCEEPLACYGPMSPTFKKLLIQFYPEEVSSRASADSKCMITEKKESLGKRTIKKSPSPVAVSKIDKRLTQYTHALEDGDGLKVGVAELISQWVKGGEDESRNSSPSKPTEIKSGDVLNKKNLWESLGDALPSGREGKESSSGKRCKFVVTGHGKYDKIFVDDNCSENCPSDQQFHEDL